MSKAKEKSKAKENLLAAIEMLKSVPDEQFNMEHWWLKDGMAFDEERNRIYKVADGPCGCAVGHLIQRGLLAGDVIKDRDRAFWQISDALGIYNDTIAEFLFDQYTYPRGKRITKEDVIRRIEFVISEM